MLEFGFNNKYLIGVSGGPDSMFLLSELVKQKPKEIVVCHVNYNFRSDSINDQKIVEEFCNQHDLILEVKVIDPLIYQASNFNFEAWAREERYNFFCEMGEKYQINNLLIAHNQNDHIETYLMQLRRQNLNSYWGIQKVSTYKNMTVIRPMLDFKKSEILKKLEAEKIPYVIDVTNFDQRYERNKIRSSLKESDFDQYMDEILMKNKQLEVEIKQAKKYVEKNLIEDELRIDKNFSKLEDDLIQRIVYQYFEKLDKTYLLHNRKKQTIVEISKRLKTTTKPFWKIEIGDFFLIKDFAIIYLLYKDSIQIKSFIINNPDELYLVEEFINDRDLLHKIREDKENYPYIITNDFEHYKMVTNYKNKKMNRYLIDQKISYKNRIYKAVVYNIKNLKVLNSIN
ncbi:tRNA(Ile)-lysidine synthase [Williamsoniiplasma luminosum]|uniref:tRNA(Ile)-lysidine synthase n=1 Tax=Williamsoniiplasma luminosum TaxID=214888 RepID=A0A2K8NSX9_9MOLU|nr:tRNA lysidine(34) synthetase TilS [Williamsoniiplasma luminosum]ATZ16877.1 tRNA(Ile)-lysidine synthase [Williamsoniiplasma luminosum]